MRLRVGSYSLLLLNLSEELKKERKKSYLDVCLGIDVVILDMIL